MWPVSDEFKAAIRSGAVYRTEATITVAGETVAATHSPAVLALRLSGGNVTSNQQAAIRRRFTASFEDADGTLQAALDPEGLLSPLLRPELRLSSGVRLPDGTKELVPLGVFSIEEAEARHAGGVTVTMAGRDRAARIADNRWTETYTIPEGTNLGIAIRQIITERAQGFTPQFAFVPTTRVAPYDLTFAADRDPWAECIALARDCGMVLYVDQGGVFVMRPVPDPTTDPVAFAYGPGAGLLFPPTSKSYDMATVYNGVRVVGTAPWLLYPIVGEAWDDDPLSPTYRGAFGEKPKPIESATVATEQEAEEIAAAELRKVLGIEENMRFTFVTNPAHDAGDVIEATDAALGIEAVRYVLDEVTIPLRPDGGMTATSRRRRAA